jgi:hypothetical protein
MDQNLGLEKVGLEEVACFGLLRMWLSCVSSINLFIIRLVNLIIAGTWGFSVPGLSLLGGRDKYANFHVIGYFR